jgi:hypothetical protein
MNKIYRHRPTAIDEYLGHVTAEGKVFETRLGPDQYVGRVDLEKGEIFLSRPGPDKQIGRVDKDSGKVYLTRLGPDEYLGRVQEDGKIVAHKPLAPDVYLGHVEEMLTVIHGGAGFLLLLKPVLDEKEATEGSEEPGTAETGGEAAPV